MDFLKSEKDKRHLDFSLHNPDGSFIENNILQTFRKRLLDILENHNPVEKLEDIKDFPDYNDPPEIGNERIYDRFEKINNLLPAIEHFMKSIVENKKPPEQYKVFNALILAIKVHIDAPNRKEGQPVIGHVIEVAQNIIDTYSIYDTDSIIAALLHDTIEDNPEYLMKRMMHYSQEAQSENISRSALNHIMSLFGKDISLLVERTTKPNFEPLIKAQKGLGRKVSESDIKSTLYKDFIHDTLQHPKALIVKFSDFEINALDMLQRDMPDSPQKTHQMLKYYAAFPEFISAFKNLSKDHPLFAYRDKILEKITDAQFGYEYYFRRNNIEFKKIQE